MNGKVHPEAALEVDELGVLCVVERRHHRLERHATNGAVTRAVPADLRVHRAGVDRAGFRRDGVRRRGSSNARDVLLRLGAELRLAFHAAEVVRLAVVLDVMRRLSRHGHAAHWVLQGVACRGRGVMVMMTVVRVARVLVLGRHVHDSVLTYARLSGPTVAAAAPTMTTMACVPSVIMEQVHQRARQQQQAHPVSGNVVPVLTQKVNAADECDHQQRGLQWPAQAGRAASSGQVIMVRRAHEEFFLSPMLGVLDA